MPKVSAGLLVYRFDGDGVPQVLLVHPGGPFWARKDDGAWSVPKGEHEARDDPLACARREFEEEIGQDPPEGDHLDLGEVRQPGGKRVRCFAVGGDVDVTRITSNEFEIEWPPRSGRTQSFPEVDRAAWFTVAEARRKILRGQVELVDRLVAALGTATNDPRER